MSSLIIDEIRRIVKTSEIMKEDDGKWPQKNKDGRQELEIRLGNEHISFEVGMLCPPFPSRKSPRTMPKSPASLSIRKHAGQSTNLCTL